LQRVRIEIEGIVQGVGFRPFVYQLARRLGVAGWVCNDSRGVLIEVQAEPDRVAEFLRGLREEHPPLASISRFEVGELRPLAEEGFAIRGSESGRRKTAQIAPDTYVCDDCLEELFDPGDRRYRYPFINCTNCGPRYTIVTGIPYDRPKTTMVDFPMCAVCREEYENPASRRFHAQPNACPDCGPRLALTDAEGRSLTGDPVDTAVRLLAEGRIVAVKGLGGYHLAVDAASDVAVAELRRRKARDEKPFALMARSVEEIERFAWVDEAERRLLVGVERPIVLLHKKPGQTLSGLVAPNNRYLGFMLPYTPLHYLLLERFPALVMTSANLSDEPISYEDDDALRRLGGIADLFLRHDRRIHIRTDDSIARVMAGSPVLLRRSRGFVPRGVVLPRAQEPVLALGAELKNTICLTRQDRAYLSQHVGDLRNAEVFVSFEKTVALLREILELRPRIVAHDLHPDYYSSRYAEGLDGVRRVAVQHHHAHLAACLAENGVEEETIGVIFDGLGYGADGLIWGGEFLVGNAEGYRRVGHFAYVPMPGGDAATREPRRMALSYLVHALGDDLPALPLLKDFSPVELTLLRQMIDKGINSPLTSSCGRLFDGVAALVGLRGRVSYEGQAALELEMAIEGEGEEGEYPFAVDLTDGLLIFDPASLIRALVEDLQRGATASAVSARFHNTLARMVVEICRRVRQRTGLNGVALSGGVFQNRYLTERSVALLQEDGFRVLTHSLVPPNDGGLALGQAVVAGAAGLHSQGR